MTHDIRGCLWKTLDDRCPPSIRVMDLARDFNHVRLCDDVIWSRHVPVTAYSTQHDQIAADSEIIGDKYPNQWLPKSAVCISLASCCKPAVNVHT